MQQLIKQPSHALLRVVAVCLQVKAKLKLTGIADIYLSSVSTVCSSKATSANNTDHRRAGPLHQLHPSDSSLDSHACLGRQFSLGQLLLHIR